MTRRKQMLFALALAGLLVALAILVGLSRPNEATASIVSLKRDVLAGQVLSAEDLVLVSLPEKLVTSFHLRAVEAAAGSAPLHDLHAGQLLDCRWIRDQPEGVAYPAAAVDNRLYTLRVPPEHANGFWLAAGNRVDVHLVRRNESARTATEMLPDMLPAIRIAALLDEGGGGGQPIATVAGQAGEPLVCLSVTAAEARILALSELSCLIKLVPLNEPNPVPGSGFPFQAGGSGGLLGIEADEDGSALLPDQAKN